MYKIETIRSKSSKSVIGKDMMIVQRLNARGIEKSNQLQ